MDKENSSIFNTQIKTNVDTLLQVNKTNTNYYVSAIKSISMCYYKDKKVFKTPVKDVLRV